MLALKPLTGVLIIGSDGSSSTLQSPTADALLAALVRHRANTVILRRIGTSDPLAWARCVRAHPSMSDLSIVIVNSLTEMHALKRIPQERLKQQLDHALPQPKPNSGSQPLTMTIDQPGREIISRGGRATFSPMEFRMLLFLMRHPDVVFSRAELLWRVSSSNGGCPRVRTVDVLVRTIRRKIVGITGAQEVAWRIQTIRRYGYRFLSHDVTLIDRLTGKAFQFWPSTSAME